MRINTLFACISIRKGGMDLMFIVLALCLALVIDVSWKWKFIVLALLAASFVVPAHLVGTEYATAANIGAIIVKVLLAVVYLIRRQLPAGVFDL